MQGIGMAVSTRMEYSRGHTSTETQQSPYVHTHRNSNLITLVFCHMLNMLKKSEEKKEKENKCCSHDRSFIRV